MPKISADSVAEHVAQQRAAVLDAAVALFVERGYGEVSLGDVASTVGLARNSLYRYVPDKLHLLVEWYRRAVPETIASWEAAVAGDDPAVDRLTRWAHAYLTWARSPEHQLVGPLTEAIPTLGPETRAEVLELHRSMLDVVSRVVAEAGVPDVENAATVQLLSGLVLGAARAEEQGDAGRPWRDRLDRAIAATVG